MDLEAGLVAHLQSDPNVAALVATRVYPIRLPQSVTLPALTFQQVSGVRDLVHGQPSGMANPRIQITSWAATYAAANGLARAVRIALNGVDAVMGEPSGIRVTALLVNEIELFEPDAQIHQHVQDYRCWAQELVA
jgi:hypothetical protein